MLIIDSTFQIVPCSDYTPTEGELAAVSHLAETHRRDLCGRRNTPMIPRYLVVLLGDPPHDITSHPRGDLRWFGPGRDWDPTSSALDYAKAAKWLVGLS